MTTTRGPASCGPLALAAAASSLRSLVAARRPVAALGMCSGQGAAAAPAEWMSRPPQQQQRQGVWAQLRRSRAGQGRPMQLQHQWKTHPHGAVLGPQAVAAALPPCRRGRRQGMLPCRTPMPLGPPPQLPLPPANPSAAPSRPLQAGAWPAGMAHYLTPTWGRRRLPPPRRRCSRARPLALPPPPRPPAAEPAALPLAMLCCLISIVPAAARAAAAAGQQRRRGQARVQRASSHPPLSPLEPAWLPAPGRWRAWGQRPSPAAARGALQRPLGWQRQLGLQQQLLERGRRSRRGQRKQQLRQPLQRQLSSQQWR